jgi:ATP-dependent protease ClpP protease subunit
MKRINMIGEIGWSVTVRSVIEELNDAAGEDVEIYIHTPGGMVYEALGIYQQIKNYSGKTKILLGGLVASAGTYLSTAGDEIIADESTAYMIHNAWSCLCGDFKAFEKEAKELRRVNKHIAERLSEISGKTIEEIFTMMDDETWLYGEEITTNGFATRTEKTTDAENSIDKDLSIAQGREKVAACMKRAAAIKYSDKLDYSEKENQEKPKNKEPSVGKENDVQQAIALIKAEMNTVETANAFGISVMDKDSKEILSALKENNITDPIGVINDLKDQISKNEDQIRDAKLTKFYGKSEEKNLKRNYAEKVTASVSVENLDSELEKLKNDPVMKSFGQQEADNDSALNLVESESDKNNDSDIIKC